MCYTTRHLEITLGGCTMEKSPVARATTEIKIGGCGGTGGSRIEIIYRAVALSRMPPKTLIWFDMNERIVIEIHLPATFDPYATPAPQILLSLLAEISPAHRVPWLKQGYIDWLIVRFLRTKSSCHTSCTHRRVPEHNVTYRNVIKAFHRWHTFNKSITRFYNEDAFSYAGFNCSSTYVTNG